VNEPESSSTALQSETEITLGVLNAVQDNSFITQRSIAQELGIALGLANAYLRRCANKGLIKVQNIPKNRYAYYLTPQGFAEKSALTAEYLSTSLNFFRNARSQCVDIFEECAQCRWTRVILVGVSDLGEIATLCAGTGGIELLGFVDENSTENEFAGRPVSHDISILRTADAAVVTDLRDPQAAFERCVKVVAAERVLAPKLLNIARQRPPLPE